MVKKLQYHITEEETEVQSNLPRSKSQSGRNQNRTVQDYPISCKSLELVYFHIEKYEGVISW